MSPHHGRAKTDPMYSYIGNNSGGLTVLYSFSIFLRCVLLGLLRGKVYLKSPIKVRVLLKPNDSKQKSLCNEITTVKVNEEQKGFNFFLILVFLFRKDKTHYM